MKHRLFVSVLLLSLFPFCFSSAQETRSGGFESPRFEYLLCEDIADVVVASGREEPVKEAPADVFVITGDEMISRGYRSIYDLLPDLPGLTWQNMVGNDKNGHPVIRGILYQERLKILLNGMELDEKAGSGYGLDQRLPIEGIDRVEFIIGPYASLYGRNTFSGVINIITRSGKIQDGGLVDLVYGKWDRIQGTFLYGKKINEWDLYFSAFKNYSREGQDLTKDYPQYYARENREGKEFEGEPVFFREGVSDDWFLFWDHTDLYTKIRHDSGFQFDLDWNKAVWPMTGTYLTPLFYTQPTDSRCTDTNLNARLLYEYKTQTWSSISIFQYQDWDNEGRLDYMDALYRWYITRTDSRCYEQKFQIRIGDKNKFYAGISYEDVHALIPQGSERLPVPTKPDISGDDYLDLSFLNLTVQNETDWSDKIKTVAGFMYEHCNSYDDVYVPRFSFMWLFSENTTWKFLYGGGYKTPDLLVRIDQIVGDTGNVKGTTEIKPENLDSYEINWIHRLNDQIKLTAAVYLNQVEDLIASGPSPNLPPGYTTTYMNVGKQQTKGGELNINWTPTDRIKLFGSYGHVSGYYEEVDEDGSVSRIHRLPLSSPDHVKAGIYYLCWGDKLNLYIHDLYLSEITTWTSEKLDGYNLVDFHMNTTSVFSDEWWISFRITNLFDKKAFDAPSDNDPGWVPNAPIKRRGWTVQVGYRW